MSTISDAIRIAYPDAIETHSGLAFIRPEWTGDRREYNSGFYWQNLDGDRFYFDTFDAAAEDLATEIGFTDSEACDVLNRAYGIGNPRTI